MAVDKLSKQLRNWIVGEAHDVQFENRHPLKAGEILMSQDGLYKCSVLSVNGESVSVRFGKNGPIQCKALEGKDGPYIEIEEILLYRFNAEAFLDEWLDKTLSVIGRKSER